MKRSFRIRSLRPDPVQDFRVEIESHLELEVEALMAGGMSAEEARREARRRLQAHRLAEPAARRHAIRHRRRQALLSWLPGLIREFRLAFRAQLRHREFSAMAVVIVAVGTGATTLMFAVADGVLSPNLPYPKAEELVYLQDGAHTVPRYRDWRDRMTSLQSTSAVWETEIRVDGMPTGSPLRLAMVTPDFLPMFGGKVTLGRTFVADDFVGQPRSVILSNAMWRQEFGADSAVIGRRLRVGDLQVTIIGVVDGGFVSPNALAGQREGLFAPLDVDRPDLQQDHLYVLGVFGRIREDADPGVVRAESERIAAELHRENPTRYTTRNGQPFVLRTAPLREAFTGAVGRPIALGFGAVVLVLVIGCVNLANLLLGRGLDRTDEVGLRYALGAGRLAVVRQLLVESVTLSALGGAAGLGLSILGLRVLRSTLPAGLPFGDQIAIDLRVVVFAVAVAVLTGVLFGLAPAWVVSRASPSRALVARGGGGGGDVRRMHGIFVFLQTSLALVLLTSAGLLFNSFVRLRSVDLGFRPDGLVAVRLSLPDNVGVGERRSIDRALVDAVDRMPGVKGAALGESAPFLHYSGLVAGTFTSSITPAGGRPVQAEAGLYPVTPGYLKVLGASLEGRSLLPGDEARYPTPSVISKGLARRLFPSGDAIGGSFETSGRAFSVVGVVSGLRYWGQRSTMGQIFSPWTGGGDTRTLLVRAVTDPGELARRVRERVSTLGSAIEVRDTYLMADRVEASLAGPRFLMLIALGFALFSSLVASSGIYGVILYAVVRRRRELSIRMALGAPSSTLTWTAVHHVLRPAALGLMVGGIASLGVARLLASLLFGVSPSDWPTHLGALALLGAATLFACLIPTWRVRSSHLPSYLRCE